MRFFNRFDIDDETVNYQKFFAEFSEGSGEIICGDKSWIVTPELGD